MVDPSQDPSAGFYAGLGPAAALLHVLPFALLLLLIAVLPLLPAAAHWWERNRNKLLVSLLLGAAGVLLYYIPTRDGSKLLHTAVEYLAFLALLGSLFVISGGIHISGRFAGFPWVNTLFLALGAVLANLLGTTGASMMLIRPLLRANQHRQHKTHIVIFFIFIVSNTGGLLTPLGDPPLFLGFLRGVPFDWTLRFFKEWVLVQAVLLLVFHLLDEYHFLKEDLASRASLVDELAKAQRRIHIEGRHNLWLLGGVTGVILASGYLLSPFLIARYGEAHAALAGGLFQAMALAGLGLLSWRTTAKSIHEANHFGFGPILEVAALFLGIFAAMLPALALLSAKGAALGLTRPWQYFWATGLLSSFLDNAPTYLTFATLAASTSGLPTDHLGELAAKAPRLLEAVSLGAVLMGANSYIGNGPNFMVKAIAEHRGVRMPGFGGYLLWSGAVLIPIFALLTWIFFT
jgi:Na+/H+ antiporter NhaD/arsenite permease-like protein